MKLIHTIFVLFIFASFSIAQPVQNLPTTKAEFIKELDNLFSATKRSDLSDLMKEFKKQVDAGTVSDATLTYIIASSNQMLNMGGKAYPQLQQILTNYMSLSQAELSSSEWSDFQTTFIKVMENSKKGDTKSSLDFADFAIYLYQKNALYESKGKTWYLSKGNYRLSYKENKPMVSVNTAVLKGASSVDTVTIENTAGEFDVLEKKWYGTQGRADWTRAGLPAQEVFVTFDKYEIDLISQGFIVEDAKFTYKNYFDKILTGVFEDKILPTVDENIRYPKFSALRENVPPQKITNNVTFYGGFSLIGSKMLNKSENELSQIVITKPNSTVKVMSAYTKSVTVDLPEKILSRDAEISLYFENDSIYHPSVDFSYDLQKNEIKFTKGENSLSQSNFKDSYHKLDFNLDVITWDLNADKMNLNTISTSGIRAANFESQEYFSKESARQIRGQVNYDPLSLLRVQASQGFDNEVHADLLAKAISPSLSVQQLKPLLYNLIQEGFITFDEKKEIIKVLPKVEHYVLSNAEKKDFDNIVFKSNTKGINAEIDLKSNNFKLSGVKLVPVNLATSTLFFPKNQEIVVEKNRDMLFDGLVFCGRLDAFGRENHFNYTDFTVDLPILDTLIMNIPDGDKLDVNGNAILRPINSVLEDLKGKFTINLPINKSGTSELPQFPMFESFETSKVFYESSEIMNGTYKKDQFYYEISPFKMDSLLYLDIPNLKFNGTFYSANIFQPIKQPLSVQDDLSLGFELKSPSEGFELYQGKGKFVSDIKLSNQGLEGKGDVSYQTASFYSDNILFYPDSLKAISKDFILEETSGTYESPAISSFGNNVKWTPYQDYMIAYSVAGAPFKMYDDRVKLDGNIEITNKGVNGAGLADWDEAELISNNFKLKSQEMSADTASLQIKSIEGDKVTFNTPNVSAYVDFKENTGEFKSNTNDNRTEFNYNEYVTTIDEFFWDIDNKTLEFSVPEGAPPAPFISLKLEQDTLLFMATNAIYNLQTSIIDASGVSEILIADSRVIPGDGKVSVLPAAEMQPLTNATIEATAANKQHLIKDVNIDIDGKYNVKGSGNYVYKTKGTEEQLISMRNIDIIKLDTSDKKKGEKEFYALHASGHVAKDEDFIVYPNTFYYGNIDMVSVDESLKTEGYAKIDFRNVFAPTDFFTVKGEVNAENLGLTIEGAETPSGNKVRTGIFIDKAGMEPLYTNILNDQLAPLSKPMIEVGGMVIHDDATNLYTFGNKEVIQSEEIIKGNTLKFSPTDNEVQAEGAIDLGLDMFAFKSKASGKVNTNLQENNFDLNATIALPFQFDKTVLEKIGFYLFEDNFDMADVNYETAEIQKQWANLLDEKAFKKMQEEVATTTLFAKPKSLSESIVFTNVNLSYSQTERLFRSKGKFGLAFVGDRGIHKEINGYLEFGHRLGADYINLYLKTSFNDYIFITFTTSQIEIASSFDDLPKMINVLKTEQRTIKGENNRMHTYLGVSEAKANLFMDRMKILEQGGTLPPPEPPKEKPQEILIENEDVKGDNAVPGDSPKIEEETAPQNENPGIPQEILDYEEGKKDKKKNKGE